MRYTGLTVSGLSVSLMLMGCSPTTLRAVGLLASSNEGAADGSPIARATNGASAAFTMITCPQTVPGARVVEETLVQLNQQGVIVVADGPGTTTRVTLNMCGSGGVYSSPAPPVRR